MGKIIKRRGSVRDPLYCVLVFTLVTGSATLIHRLNIPYSSILIPALWGAGALLPGWKGDFPPPAIGLRKSQLVKGLKLFLLSSVFVFPLYSAVFFLYIRIGFPAPADLISSGMSVFHWILYNIAVVAFFEELFFRGYLQGQLIKTSETFRSGHRWVFWFPIVSASFLFALAHAIVYMNLAGMAVFFPSLLFGWLRARTGSLLAPILSHGSANVISMLLIRSVT
jgi:membrane protease YdiL (CAAX protease family)